MKKFYVLSVYFALILIFTNTTFAQLIRLGVSAGLTDVTNPPFYTNNISDNGEAFKTNYNIGFQARLDVPLSPLTPIVFIDYYMLRGSGNIGGTDVTTKQNIWSVGVEAEYNILPLPVVKPYISVEAAINNFGELSTGFISGNSFQGNITRYGGALGVGAVITILPVVDLDASLKYHLFNLIGKSSNEPGINALTIDVALIF
jgi:hypothetical protein